MNDSGNGERLTPVLDSPAREGRVNALRIDYAPGGFSDVHRHPAGAYVYVMEGSVMLGLENQEPVLVKAGESFYEPPGALHTVSRNASEERPASMIAFFVLDEGQSATVQDDD